VLAGFDELPVATAYEIDGQTTHRFPPDAGALARATPIYDRLPGFSEDISRATSWSDLPDNARRYVDYIETFVDVPVKTISVGPDRNQTIDR
jgi:adenylosuccinate synthase